VFPSVEVNVWKAGGIKKRLPTPFLSTDLVKTARLFLAPLQLAAAFQDRFEKFLREKVIKRVPEQRYVQPPPELIGPAMQHMRYLDYENPLWEMFEELLLCSLDKQNLSKAHPAFAQIIMQLSRDETLILYRLRGNEFHVIDTMEYVPTENRFQNRIIEHSDIPTVGMYLPHQLELYYSHLESLNLVTWPVFKQVPILDETDFQTGLRRHSKMHLTDFGKLFVSACIPEEGFRGLRE
jgi:hypothetical protein